MADLVRLRTEWSGPGVVGPGVTTMFFDPASSGFVAAVNTFWESIKTNIPTGTTLTTPNTGDLIDVDTGQLSGTWTDAAAGPVLCTGGGSFAAGVGARVSWRTDGVRNGRRVRGATFVCPLIVSGYDANGTISTSILNSINTNAGTLVSTMAGDFKIYSRPGGGLAGQVSTVLSQSTADAVSWLRSRRT